MPPKRKDKGKWILKDPVPQTPSKESQTSPPKEKLLSSAINYMRLMLKLQLIFNEIIWGTLTPLMFQKRE